MADETAIATGDAVTIRALSEDGEWLIPVATYHPDDTIRSAMERVMVNTAARSDSGMWAAVLEQRRPVRWRVTADEMPPEASAKQIDFMRRYPVRATLGAPVVAHERIVGAVSLVRYVVDRAYSDEDETLLVRVAERIAPILEAAPRGVFPLPRG